MRLRVLTYNIHKAIGVDGKFAPERIVQILEHYDADVALLQEVDRGVPRSGMLDLAMEIARRLDYHHRAVGMNVYMRRGMYGNATLSRYPIGRQHNIDLTIGGAKRRGAQHTRVHLRQRNRAVDVDLFNIHLSLTARLRRQQMLRLLHSADITHLSPDAPVIVAGDMNDWQGLLKRRYFRPAGFACATNKGPGSRWAIKTFPSYAPAGGLDKIFYRGHLELRHVFRSKLEVARVASDHLPVVADFAV